MAAFEEALAVAAATHVQGAAAQPPALARAATSREQPSARPADATGEKTPSTVTARFPAGHPCSPLEVASCVPPMENVDGGAPVRSGRSPRGGKGASGTPASRRSHGSRGASSPPPRC
jgi:hypothetical protein